MDSKHFHLPQTVRERKQKGKKKNILNPAANSFEIRASVQLLQFVLAEDCHQALFFPSLLHVCLGTRMSVPAHVVAEPFHFLLQDYGTDTISGEFKNLFQN